MQDLNRFLVQGFIVTFHVQNLQKSVALPTVVIRVDDHKSSLTLLYVFGVRATLFPVVTRVDRDHVVHDLECCAEHVDEFDYLDFRLFVLVSQLCNQTQHHAR